MVRVRWRRSVDDDDEASDDLQPEMAMAGSHLVSTEGPLVCTCALEISFRLEGEVKIHQGTGFLVSLPKWYQKDLIMTAGHNLISSEGSYAEQINVIFYRLKPITVKKDQYFASKSYEKTPNGTNAVNDYGAIIIEKNPDDPDHPGGFGYSLLVKKEDLVGMRATVHGYPLTGKIRKPANAFGNIMDITGGQLKYRLTTLPGHSGGPVCIERNGFYTVVGIHNYGAKETNSGTLFTCEILFELLKELDEIKSLKLYDSKAKDHNNDIFLKIPPGSGARVLARQGKDKYTSLAFIPVETYWPGEEYEYNKPKCIIATPHLKPATYLTFHLTENSGSVITARSQDLVDNRPESKDVAVLGFKGLAGAFSVSMFDGKYLLRIQKDKLDGLRSQKKYDCDCTVLESRDIDLVPSTGMAAKTNTKFCFS